MTISIFTSEFRRGLCRWYLAYLNAAIWCKINPRGPWLFISKDLVFGKAAARGKLRDVFLVTVGGCRRLSRLVGSSRRIRTEVLFSGTALTLWSISELADAASDALRAETLGVASCNAVLGVGGHTGWAGRWEIAYQLSVRRRRRQCLVFLGKSEIHLRSHRNRPIDSGDVLQRRATYSRHIHHWHKSVLIVATTCLSILASAKFRAVPSSDIAKKSHSSKLKNSSSKSIHSSTYVFTPASTSFVKKIF